MMGVGIEYFNTGEFQNNIVFKCQKKKLQLGLFTTKNSDQYIEPKFFSDFIFEIENDHNTI